jgi:hypothetical protein
MFSANTRAHRKQFMPCMVRLQKIDFYCFMEQLTVQALRKIVLCSASGLPDFPWHMVTKPEKCTK